MMDGAQAARKPWRQTKFDVAERERIRHALLAYARDNRIGAPNLQLHIAEKLGRTVDEVGALKTLQRFLTGEGRVNDGFITVCAAFVERTGAMTSHDELAHDLGAFFMRDIADQPADEVPSRLAGDYEIWASEIWHAHFVVKSEHMKPGKSYNLCRISGSGRGLKVHELATASESAYGSFRPAANEGVMLYFDPLIFILLKNRLTRLPRVYWLREGQHGYLRGEAVHGNLAEPDLDPPPCSGRRNHELRPIRNNAS